MKPATMPQDRRSGARATSRPSSEELNRQSPVQASGDASSLASEIAEWIETREQAEIEGDGDVYRGLHAYQVIEIVTRFVYANIAAFGEPLNENVPEEVRGTVRGAPFRAWLIEREGNLALYEVEPC